MPRSTPVSPVPRHSSSSCGQSTFSENASSPASCFCILSIAEAELFTGRFMLSSKAYFCIKRLPIACFASSSGFEMSAGCASSSVNASPSEFSVLKHEKSSICA